MRSAAEKEAAEAERKKQAELARAAAEEAEKEKALAEQKAAIEHAAAEKAMREAEEAEARAAEAEAAEKAAADLAEDMSRAAQRATRAAAAKRRISMQAAERAAEFLDAFAEAAAFEEAEAEKEAATPDISDSNAKESSQEKLGAKRRTSVQAQQAVLEAKKVRKIELEAADSFIDIFPTFFEDVSTTEKAAETKLAARKSVRKSSIAPARASVSSRRKSSFVDFYPTFFEVEDPSERSLDEVTEPKVAAHFVVPAPNQSPEATKEVAAVAEAVKATADAAPKASVVPAGYVADAIVIDKKELSTKLGITLSNQEDKDHPVVCAISDDGAAATPACQLQGKLEAGDRILEIEAATNVVRVETDVDCKSTAVATTAMLKKAVGVLKVGIIRDGEAKVVEVPKPTPTSQLGVVIESSKAWKHPKIREVKPGCPSTGLLQPGDIVTSIEAPTEVAKLETHHATAKHTVASGFLKAAVGPISLKIHRLKDASQRRKSVAALKPQELATTDAAPVLAAVVTNVAPATKSARRSTKVFSAQTSIDQAEAADLLKDDAPPALKSTASSFVDFYPISSRRPRRRGARLAPARCTLSSRRPSSQTRPRRRRRQSTRLSRRRPMPRRRRSPSPCRRGTRRTRS